MQPGWSHEGAAYARGLLNGRNQGRVATLRLVYIGAAIAADSYDRSSDEWEHDIGAWCAALDVASATLNTLASLGDETAIGLLAERP